MVATAVYHIGVSAHRLVSEHCRSGVAYGYAHTYGTTRGVWGVGVKGECSVWGEGVWVCGVWA